MKEGLFNSRISGKDLRRHCQEGYQKETQKTWTGIYRGVSCQHKMLGHLKVKIGPWEGNLYEKRKGGSAVLLCEFFLFGCGILATLTV
jgi:hypothetical protein